MQVQQKPPRIPDHEVLCFIGSGAYGEIWMARSLTGALRAVKVVSRKTFGGERGFDREFEGMSAFEPISRAHGGLVDILHVGRQDRRGLFYYVMELADDREHGRKIDPATYAPRTLREELGTRKRVPADECLAVGTALAEALEFLHGKGLIHRDIKPGNVIFVEGVPKLADIGLVAPPGQQSFVGTEGYVPPEGPNSAQADVYSLGKVLYEMMTGNDRMAFPELPSDFGVGPGRERCQALNRVILKACAVNPAKRHAGASELRGDLERIAGKEKVTGAGSGASKSSLAVAVLVAVGVAAAGVGLWLNRGPGGYGGIEVRTDPPGAQVRIDRGSPVNSPATFAHVSSGSHTISVALDGFDELSSAVNVARDEKHSIGPLKLVRSTGGVEVVTTPAGVHFEISSRELGTRGGRTPARLERIPTGHYNLLLERPGWPLHREDLDVRAGDLARVSRLFKDEERMHHPEPGRPWQNSLGMKFVPVPGVDPLLGVWETRVRDFAAFVDATGYDATGWMSSLKNGEIGSHGATWRQPGFSQNPDSPVVGVSWKDAIAFCRWLTEKERQAGLLRARQSYRLPLDLEWSRAVGLDAEVGATPGERSNVLKIFPWGKQWPPPPNSGNYAGEEMRAVDWPSNWKVIAGFRDEYGPTAPVGSFAPNGFGLFDLGGNVWEWCLDKYAETGDARLVRGGSWANVTADLLLASRRVDAEPDIRNDAYGFRTVVETYEAGSVSITTKPDDAIVIADGRELGRTPLELADVETGERSFVLKKAGYKSVTLTAAVSRDGNSKLHADLKPNMGPQRGEAWTNSLGMRFVPVGDVLVCVWETRVADYEAYSTAVGHARLPAGFEQTPDDPAVRVSWEDASGFCEWLSKKEKQEELLQAGEIYRLPTDLEWSAAAGLEGEKGDSPQERDSRVRGVYPWGEQWPPPPKAGNYADSAHRSHRDGIPGRDDGFPYTAPVGSFLPNRLGLYDIGGNVWEWILDRYRSGGRDWGILRGGSWANDSPPTLLSSYRNVVARSDGDVIYGFRCVVDFNP